MTAPTAERLATLVRFHSRHRHDARCETCEVIAAHKEVLTALRGAVYCIDHHFVDENVGGQPCDCDQAIAARGLLALLIARP